MSILDKFCQYLPVKPSDKPESWDVPEHSQDKDRILDPENQDITNETVFDEQLTPAPDQLSKDIDIKNPERDIQKNNTGQPQSFYPFDLENLNNTNNQHPEPTNFNEKQIKYPWLIDLENTSEQNHKIAQVSENSEEEGSILFYIDPKTREVVYAVDGLDNRHFYSYLGIKDAVLAHPTRLAHYDIWFNRQFTDTEIKNFIKLASASDTAFFYKAAEIEGKIREWSGTLTYGVLSPDLKKLEVFSQVEKPRWITGILQFFGNLSLIYGSTMVYYNKRFEGTAGDLLEANSQMKGKIEIYTPPENEELMNLVQAWKSGNEQAGNALLEKYDLLIKSVVNKYCKAYKVGVHDKDDLLQEAYVKFLTKLEDYNPKLGALSTFVFDSTTGMLRNAINRKEKRKEILYVEDMDTFADKEITSSVSDFTTSKFLHSVVDKLPDRLRIAVSMKFFDNKSLFEIGNRFGITNEAARQLILKGLEQLRYDPKVQELDYHKISQLKSQI